MTTFLLSILVGNLVLEAACAYLIYRKRHLIRAAIRNFIGIDDTHLRIDGVQYRLDKIDARTKFIRKSQKAAEAASPVFADSPVTRALRAGQLIEAIKVYRNIHQSSLVEAKNAVEALRDSMRAAGEIA